MKREPGTYALVLQCAVYKTVQIGRWKALEIRPGYYIYVGSAFGPGGVLARVSRHARKNKSNHWHIDYLREFVCLTSVWYSHDPMRLEHEWAQTLANTPEYMPVSGFGSSDCRCEAHLFFLSNEPELVAFRRAVGSSKPLSIEDDQ
ncbi:MAG: GIY-YIG nuclease family protein [Ardenticatenaceae bacterium]|nr:GIY-YIG nuclease family protein [Ardenticatenaceae bacterium]